MLIEVGYTIQQTKDSPQVNSWTYFPTKSITFDSKCVAEANRQFKKFATSMGLTRKCKLTSIQLINNEKTTASTTRS